MDRIARRLRRLVLPTVGFAAVLGVHFLWLGLFPEQDPAQAAWARVPQPEGGGWVRRYIETGDYWLGYAYALPLAFALVALRRYRERRFCGAGRLALGGVTLSGALSVASCFLIGCCGSPMLGVYLSLFGAGVLPLAKPIVAGLTTLMILGCYLWMRQRTTTLSAKAESFGCCGENRHQPPLSQCAAVLAGRVEQNAE